MRYETVPEDGLKRFRERRHELRINGRNHDDFVTDLSGIAAVAPHNAEYAKSAPLRLVQGKHDIWTDIPHRVTASDRENKDGVAIAGAAGLEPFGENRLPALIVGACSELRHVVDWGICLDPTQLAEIIHGMAAVGRAAADPKEKQAPASRSEVRQGPGQTIDRAGIN